MSTQPATDEACESGGGRLGAVWRCIVSPAIGKALWATSIVALAVLVIWSASDVMFGQAVVAQKGQLLAVTHAQVPDAPPRQLGYRVAILWGLTGVGVVTLLGIFALLFAGPASHRSLRSWFALTLLVAAWLSVCVAWPEIAWQARRFSVWSRLKVYVAVELSLRHDWPTADGERPELGPFMVYPKGNPRTLMLLTTKSTLPLATVERSEDDTLRFELRRVEPGTWLESHPAHSLPGDFTSGLGNEYHFQRSSPLGGGWYLVRYR